ncbi:hypothetical protein M153_3070007233 [Pseudoloma neurophilia]|uniref:Uncharacterized protein n=1 Tax=Pseudoloma neurophilia TaxID=146866 RepID=A0A0R0M2D4_9MICR|nr:hypothetical protein M153_3070007233 [Pseudoloma neurophilia]
MHFRPSERSLHFLSNYLTDFQVIWISTSCVALAHFSTLLILSLFYQMISHIFNLFFI